LGQVQALFEPKKEIGGLIGARRNVARKVFRALLISGIANNGR